MGRAEEFHGVIVASHTCTEEISSANKPKQKFICKTITFDYTDNKSSN